MKINLMYHYFQTTDPMGPIPPKDKLWAPPTHGCVGADGLEIVIHQI